ncbi:hypothetical protein POTOM_059016 [Populus tomentosa]|uniref:Pentatricopeptide repeat-containing protein n=1 Tax=Populus tomentosa TaxID=118781 RepID=A0A8X7XVC7_POPTO|nr:hypothetical protein POTOM_059016 [Populus tomentosa]
MNWCLMMILELGVMRRGQPELTNHEQSLGSKQSCSIMQLIAGQKNILIIPWYAYPPPDGNILTNIVNALIAVPRFYTQFSSIGVAFDEQMNIPAPFRMALPTPPLPPAAPVPPPPPPRPRISEKSPLAEQSSSETEMESSDEEFDDKALYEASGAVKPRRKRVKREAIVGPVTDKTYFIRYLRSMAVGKVDNVDFSSRGRCAEQVADGEHPKSNMHSEGLSLFQRMVLCEGIKPTEITILAILPAISNMWGSKVCSLIHGYAGKGGLMHFDIIANSIIDTYLKCGCVVSELRFFEDISAERKNLVSWKSIISGFAMHGMWKEAVEYFERMEKIGLRPNRVTLLSVLNACSHGRLVGGGLGFFGEMVNMHGVSPDIEHYGHVEDDWEIRRDREDGMGKRVTRKIMEMETRYGGDFVLMDNNFAGAERLRRLMKERNPFKLPGNCFV